MRKDLNDIREIAGQVCRDTLPSVYTFSRSRVRVLGVARLPVHTPLPVPRPHHFV